MLNDETQPTTYALFDNSGHGGSWNFALTRALDAAIQRADKAEQRAIEAEAVRDRLLAVLEREIDIAALNDRQHCTCYKTIRIDRACPVHGEEAG